MTISEIIRKITFAFAVHLPGKRSFTLSVAEANCNSQWLGFQLRLKHWYTYYVDRETALYNSIVYRCIVDYRASGITDSSLGAKFANFSAGFANCCLAWAASNGQPACKLSIDTLIYRDSLF